MEEKKDTLSLYVPPSTRGLDYSSTSLTRETMTLNAIIKKIDDKTIRLERRPGFYVATAYWPTTITELPNIYNWVGYQDAGILCYGGYLDGSPDITKVIVAGVTTYSYADDVNVPIYFSETTNSSGTSSLLWTRDGSDGKIYPKAGAVASITLPTGHRGGFAHLGGWTFIGANVSGQARIYNCSTLNDPTSAYNDYIAVSMSPDSLKTIWKFQNYILAFGSDSLEWFELTSNDFGSPLRSIPSRFSKLGLFETQYTTDPHHRVLNVCQGVDKVYWISSGLTQSNQAVYSVDISGKITKLSTTAVEHAMNQYSAGIFYGVIFGKEYLFLGGPGEMWVYDLELKVWSIWDTPTSFCAATQGSSLEVLYFASSGGTDIRAHNENAWRNLDDTSTPVVFKVRTEKWNGGTSKKKFIHRVRLLASKQTAAYVADGNMTLKWSTDDYTTYSSTRTMDLSSNYPYTTNLGSGYSFVFELSLSNTNSGTNKAPEIEALEIYYTEED